MKKEKVIKNLKRKKGVSIVIMLVGIIIFLANVFLANLMSNTIFFIIHFLSMIIIIAGLVISGYAANQRRYAEYEKFHTCENKKCPHCSGTGWVKKA